MRTKKYTKELPRQMYAFFANYTDNGAAPSFEKFAMSIGTTKAQLESFRRYPKFSLAWEECEEILRDYLIDRALTKKFDSSFVKYMLSSDDDGSADSDIHVRIAVED